MWGVGERLQAGAVYKGCPSCHRDQDAWAQEHHAWLVLLAAKVGQAETQGASELTNLEPTMWKLNYSEPA